MAARVSLSYEFIGEAMRHQKVRKALAEKARKVQTRAESIAAAEGESIRSTVEEGTRPKGRPYARVSSPDVAQEYGTSVVERRRILGRAAESS